MDHHRPRPQGHSRRWFVHSIPIPPQCHSHSTLLSPLRSFLECWFAYLRRTPATPPMSLQYHPIRVGVELCVHSGLWQYYTLSRGIHTPKILFCHSAVTARINRPTMATISLQICGNSTYINITLRIVNGYNTSWFLLAPLLPCFQEKNPSFHHFVRLLLFPGGAEAISIRWCAAMQLSRSRFLLSTPPTPPPPPPPPPPHPPTPPTHPPPTPTPSRVSVLSCSVHIKKKAA